MSHSISPFPTNGRGRTGSLVARALRGSWRVNLDALDLTSGEFERIAPLLMSSGTAGLGWRAAAQDPALYECAEKAGLRDAARRLAITDTLRQRSFARIIRIANDAGVAPLVFKGWSVAPVYAEAWLRPWGDIDILATIDDLDRIRLAFADLSEESPQSRNGDVHVVKTGPGDTAASVDLHGALPDLYAANAATVLGRAQRIELAEGERLLVPCDEDGLRIVILHFLRHGGWRPLWLCDVAGLVEAARPDFDWDLCLTSDTTVRDWMLATIDVAHQLLGCRIDHAPQLSPGHAPPWFLKAILAEWDAPIAYHERMSAVSRPVRPWVWLREKWPNPIRAAFTQQRPMPSRPPVFGRASQFLAYELRSSLAALASHILGKSRP